MKSKKSKAKKFPDDSAILLELADRLEQGANQLTVEERIFYRIELRRMARRSDDKYKQISAARSYSIRIELAELAGKKRQSKRIRHEVAVLYGYKDQVVADVYSKWRRIADARSRSDNNTDYEGLSRSEMLKREIQSIDDC
jgi:hypothetical protein